MFSVCCGTVSVPALCDWSERCTPPNEVQGIREARIDGVTLVRDGKRIGGTVQEAAVEAHARCVRGDIESRQGRAGGGPKLRLCRRESGTRSFEIGIVRQRCAYERIEHIAME